MIMSHFLCQSDLMSCLLTPACMLFFFSGVFICLLDLFFSCFSDTTNRGRTTVGGCDISSLAEIAEKIKQRGELLKSYSLLLIFKLGGDHKQKL